MLSGWLSLSEGVRALGKICTMPACCSTTYFHSHFPANTFVPNALRCRLLNIHSTACRPLVWAWLIVTTPPNREESNGIGDKLTEFSIRASDTQRTTLKRQRRSRRTHQRISNKVFALCKYWAGLVQNNNCWNAGAHDVA